MARLSSSTDMITAVLHSAVGDDVTVEQTDLNGNWTAILLHSDKTGSFKKTIVCPRESCFSS